MPRLKLPSEEPEEPSVPVPVPAPPVPAKEPPIENNTQYAIPTRPDMAGPVVDSVIPTNGVVRPQPLVDHSTSSQSSPESDYSAGVDPSSATGGGEESSRGVSPMTEETSSQPFIGPATQEDHQHSKMGFAGLKLG